MKSYIIEIKVTDYDNNSTLVSIIGQVEEHLNHSTTLSVEVESVKFLGEKEVIR